LLDRDHLAFELGGFGSHRLVVANEKRGCYRRPIN
jgi:hypothetical protein